MDKFINTTITSVYFSEGHLISNIPPQHANGSNSTWRTANEVILRSNRTPFEVRRGRSSSNPTSLMRVRRMNSVQATVLCNIIGLQSLLKKMSEKKGSISRGLSSHDGDRWHTIYNWMTRKTKACLGKGFLWYVFATFCLRCITLNISHFKVQIGVCYRTTQPWNIWHYLVSFF